MNSDTVTKGVTKNLHIFCHFVNDAKSENFCTLCVRVCQHEPCTLGVVLLVIRLFFFCAGTSAGLGLCCGSVVFSKPNQLHASDDDPHLATKYKDVVNCDVSLLLFPCLYSFHLMFSK